MEWTAAHRISAKVFSACDDRNGLFNFDDTRCCKSDVISVSGACNEAWLKTGCQDTFMISVLITKEYKRIFSGVHFLLNELCNVGIPFSTYHVLF